MSRQTLADAAATASLGAALWAALRGRSGGVIYLAGELGAGKTTLARGWLRAAGVDGAIRSPTYTLMECYEAGGIRHVHLDLYRLEGVAEVESLGLADYPPDAGHWWLVEWPDRGREALPAPDLEVALAPLGAGRVALVGGRLAASHKI